VIARRSLALTQAHRPWRDGVVKSSAGRVRSELVAGLPVRYLPRLVKSAPKGDGALGVNH
jgi:hypothetical protein